MNEAWVDGVLPSLLGNLGPFRVRSKSFHFEPTEEDYALLESGDEADLRSFVSRAARHLELVAAPKAEYDWGIKMDPGHAGQVRLGASEHPVKIPFHHAGKPYAVGAIIAHELTHVFMWGKGIGAPDCDENERLTDLTAICVGLGKLALNGTLLEPSGDMMTATGLGYVPHELLVYAFRKVNALRGIADREARRHLRAEIAF